jgi:RNA polymerase subunit RPABC4/transcription elongation factor Spt4
MEVVLCKECQRIKPAVPKHKLICPLCKEKP